MGSAVGKINVSVRFAVGANLNTLYLSIVLHQFEG